jgi:hypothetical protein
MSRLVYLAAAALAGCVLRLASVAAEPLEGRNYLADLFARQLGTV